jgi:hypothetical protein
MISGATCPEVGPAMYGVFVRRAMDIGGIREHGAAFGTGASASSVRRAMPFAALWIQELLDNFGEEDEGRETSSGLSACR